MLDPLATIAAINSRFGFIERPKGLYFSKARRLVNSSDHHEIPVVDGWGGFVDGSSYRICFPVAAFGGASKVRLLMPTKPLFLNESS
jgi:hypothetical protein